MNKNLILRLSNEMGNQMFMYAAGYTFAKKMNRNFYIDNESAFLLKKNISSFGLDELSCVAPIVDKKYKFLNVKGYFRRKLKKKIDFFKTRKNFFIEHKDKNKITYFDDVFLTNNFADNLYVEGHFESSKYFFDYENDIVKQFSFMNSNFYKKNRYYDLIKNSNSVSICIRQNRFSEKIRDINAHDKIKSDNFTHEQIEYIKKSIIFLEKKIKNPKFFLWSNNYDNLEKYFPENKYTFIKNDERQTIGKRSALDLFLMTQCKNFIVTPSSYNWWGAYLCSNINKIVIRPKQNNFTNYKINNIDFWPSDWISQ